MTAPSADFDSPWKEVLERFLPDLLAFCLPVAYAEVDWARGYESLDKELQQVAPDAAVGRRLVDALFKVWQLDGDEAWVLVHIEVQGQDVPAFGRRMFGYYCRLAERFDRPIASLAILTDERPGWRPDGWASELWGCAVQYRFPVVKVLDYRGRRDELAASANPFAVVVLAHLAALETRGDAAGRAGTKLALARRLYERGYTREQVVGLFRFIDWLLRLPAALEREFWQAIRQEEEARNMPYITSVERIGLRRGLLLGLEPALEAKFGAEGARLFAELQVVEDEAVLEAVAARLKAARSADEVRELLARPPVEGSDRDG